MGHAVSGSMGTDGQVVPGDGRVVEQYGQPQRQGGACRVQRVGHGGSARQRRQAIWDMESDIWRDLKRDMERGRPAGEAGGG